VGAVVPPKSLRVLRTLFLISLWLAPATAPAQSNPGPKVDVAVGYAQVHSRDVGQDFGPGVYVSLEANYREWLAVVGQFSGTTSSGPARFFGDPAAGFSAYLAGTRLSVPTVHGLGPFGQILVGCARSGNDHGGFAALAIQPGAGLDIAVHKHATLRLSVDHRLVFGILADAGATASARVLGAAIVVH
jgi:Outer membrane protein beta-barrel domain